MYIIWVFTGLAGLFFGSFLYTTAIRMAREESLWPFSHCDQCGKPVGWLGLMPILGFLLQSGKCRHCASPISLTYPLTEIFNAALVLAVLYKTGLQVELLWMLLIWETLYLLSLLDFKTLLIYPQPIMLLFITAVARIYWVHPDRLIDHILGLLCGAGVFHFISYFFEVIRKKKGLGEGDATLLGILGFLFGWQALLPIVFYAALTGIILGGGFLLLNRKGLNTPLPFGPSLGAGAFIHWFSPEWLPFLMIY